MATDQGGTRQAAPAPRSPDTPMLAPPRVDLPKAGGAIRGIGEKLAVNPATGTSSMTVPLGCTPGRSGFGPQLTLTYDSGAGNGIVGFGWNVGLASISRTTDSGLPRYLDDEDSDVFALTGAEDLVPVYRRDGSGEWAEDDAGRKVVHEDAIDGWRVRRYRPRIEGLFARIERWSRIGEPTDVHWRTIGNDNILSLYGLDPASRIADPADAGRIFSWLLCETRDDRGNVALYRYRAEDGAGVDAGAAHEANRGPAGHEGRAANRCPKRILYGNRTPALDAAGRRPRFLADGDLDRRPGEWMFEVVFDYGEHDAAAPASRDDEALDPGEAPLHPWPLREDAFSSYRAGFEIRTARLCRRMLMFHHFPGTEDDGVGEDCLVRSVDFGYGTAGGDEGAGYALLERITRTGHRRDGDGYLARSMPSLELTYSAATTGEVVETLDAEDADDLPAGLDGRLVTWTDLHGEGLAGVLAEAGGAWFYKRNVSPLPVRDAEGRPVVTARFAPMEVVAHAPNVSLRAGARLLDLAGDGLPDVVVMHGPVAGFYEHRAGDDGWEQFRPFTSRPVRDLRDPNLHFVDLDGDGTADILVTEDDAIVWHPSLGEEGFGEARRVAHPLDEERGPRVVVADGTESIHLADMSGDGLADIARIRNGEVCYWPNLGHGRFGAKVTMDDAPWFDAPDRFDPRRVHVADTDGSGTADIVYVAAGGARMWLNRSGNGWSRHHDLPDSPHGTDPAGVSVLDLLSDGTACLVWSSQLPGDAGRSMRFVRLMDGKPHLLVAADNDLGVRTRAAYAPSTRFYLEDARAGRPWVTRLPFPVQVVERVITDDLVAGNRFVNRYAYHHGHFDGIDREFRGFGMVEQWDTEERRQGVEAAGSYLPPVHTKTWFDTGITLALGEAREAFSGEWFRELGAGDAEARALRLAATEPPDGLTADELAEAGRGLRGSVLRQEIYADDAGPGATPDARARAATPYTVTEQRVVVRCLQPRGENRHGVFHTHERETLALHYDRDPADPRVQHVLTLEVDELGNTLKQATAAYGRRERISVADERGAVAEVANPALAELEPEDRDRQTTALVTYVERVLTTPVDATDAGRGPLPCDARTYELTGYPATGPAGRLAPTDLVEADPDDPGRLRLRAEHVAAFEDPPSGARRCRRLVECARTVYRADDLGSLLPLGDAEGRALVGESYQLVLTAGLASLLFEATGEDAAAVLEREGGYVATATLEGDGRFPAGDTDLAGGWWAPSGRSFLSPDPAAEGAAELAEAAAHFFVPRRVRDPFGADATAGHDGDDLLVTVTEDALGNRVTVDASDYRVLQPRRVIDPNGNVSDCAFDALGFLAGTCLSGKPVPAAAEGDSLEGFRPDLADDEIEGFLAGADPDAAARLLGDATTRIVYDLGRFARARRDAPGEPSRWRPAGVATLERETHLHAPDPPGGRRIRLTFAHCDGFGRETQRKMPAAPGAGGAPRWVGSGWTVYDAKGQPVRRYEPFFSDTHGFEPGVTAGVSDVLVRDPTGRVAAILHPNDTYEKTRFSPWERWSHDVNDTCAPRGDETGDPRTDADVAALVAGHFAALPADPPWRTWFQRRAAGELGADEETAAARAAVHADTPVTVHLDPLGRPFLTVTRNRIVCAGHDGDGAEAEISVRVELDILGNQRTVRDGVTDDDRLGRVVARFDVDLLGNRVRQRSMEAGTHRTLRDVAGNPIRAWDSRGHVHRTAYDALRRPVETRVRGAAADSDPRTLGRDLVTERIEYGEGHPDAAALNLRTRVHRHHDGAGTVTTSYDFKGNRTAAVRRFAADHTAIPDWSADPALEDEEFTTATAFDALNRAVRFVAPRSGLGRGGVDVVQPVYDEAGLLDRVDVWTGRAGEPDGSLDPGAEPPSTAGVSEIDYDAKGQRTRIAYPNGVVTVYDHDPQTYRLTRIVTTRPAGAGDGPLQDLRYTYDPAGNIVRVADAAQQAIFFRNRRVEPGGDYVYDALYRLIQATGREHLGQAGESVPPQAFDGAHTGLAHPGDGTAMAPYTERYVHDAAANLRQVQHRGPDPRRAGWTRTYSYDEPNNRLSRTVVDGAGPPAREEYAHDLHGNVVRMPHLGGGAPGANLAWDHRDHLVHADLGGGGTAHYVYDADGARVRKVIERAPGLVEERLYVGDVEIHRVHGGPIGPGSLRRERRTLHVMDDRRRIAMVETRTLDVAGDDPAPARLVRVQLGNNLGSATLELDDAAQVISYEEYAPYGGTTYQAVRSATETPKRYRYTGKERDEETGLDYFGGRYLAAWLGRWIHCDPAEFVDGLNLYLFVAGNPIRFSDPSGFGKEEQQLGRKMEKTSEQHQAAANERRTEKGLDPVQTDYQKATDELRKTIPDEVKTTPGGNQKVVDLKARHIDSARNQDALRRAADIRANLEQVKRQIADAEAAGKIGPNTKGAALRVIHDSDKGASSTEALTAWRNEANAVRQKWVEEATDPVERALRNRVFVTTTTRAAYSKATKNLHAPGPKGKGGGLVGKALMVGVAAYVLFDTGDAYAAAQTANPVANTTDLLLSGNATIRALAENIAKDAWSLNPISTVQWLFFDVLGPKHDAPWDPKLASRAQAEGRNPFCAQCHGPGGALDPNNAWNQKQREGKQVDLSKQMTTPDADTMRSWVPENKP